MSDVASPSDPPSRSRLPSWRVGSVSILSLSAGMPLGLVLTGVPAFLATVGIDVKTIGLVTLAQAPYAMKFAWAPLMDRFRPPGLHDKRGWIVFCQLVLALCTFGLASLAVSPEVAAVTALTLLIAFAAASQDIAMDGYAVEVLNKDEQGAASGFRTSVYRVGMWLGGNIAISASPFLGWVTTLGILGVMYLALIPVTFLAPEPPTTLKPPTTMRDAVWGPLVGFLQRPRALEIAAFILLYKLADNLAGALVRPFLIEMHYDAFDVGVATGTIGMVATIAGASVGGMMTTAMGVGRALWVFGLIQGLSNVGYAYLASQPVNPSLLYLAFAIETGTSGMGAAAFSALLLRLTEKRFSATQYALLSSLFAIGRTIAGPPAGALAHTLGWAQFFWVTIPCAIPGLLMLHRFAPLGSKDISINAPEGEPTEIITPPMSQLVGATTLGLVVGTLVAISGVAYLNCYRAKTPWVDAVAALVAPTSASTAVDLVMALLFGGVAALAAGAMTIARVGAAARK